MRRTVATCAPGLAPWELDDLERLLIDTAAEGWAADDLLRWSKRVPEHANPNGGRPDPSEPAPVATVKRRELRNGLVRWVLDFDTLTDGFLKTAVEVARMLAADAEIIPVVLGGASQPLDLGTGRRFFTEAQRRLRRTRLRRPPSWCDGAHIRLAGHGPASIDNGVLLCWRYHLLHDEHGWQIERQDGRWWWTPPSWIDPTGRRTSGGRIAPVSTAA